MEDYVQKLKTYIMTNQVTFEVDCPQPCLDALWWHYGEYHNLDSAAAKDAFRALRALLDALPTQDSDPIFTEINGLCAEYERAAFTAGLRLGAQLILELQDS